MKWLILLLMMVLVQGCGGNKGGDGAEDVADAVSEADTAEVPSGSNPENLAPLDNPVAENTTAEPSSEPEESTQLAEDTPPTPPAVDAPVVNPEPETSVTESNSNSGYVVQSYTVKKGDTLMKIAFETYGDISKWKDIYNLNRDKLQNANVLAVGTELKYSRPEISPSIERNGEPYKIKQGDTLGSIADDIYGHKSKWKKIYENNRTLIKDPNKIYAGFYLYYQMTEAEKSEVEQIKSGRGGADQLGKSKTEELPDSASVVKPIGGGLNSLTGSGSTGRLPAAAAQQK